MIDEKFFLGFPKNYKNLCKIYPPQVKDVIGNDKFPLYKKILTLSQEELEDEFNEKGLDLKEILSPLEYLFNNDLTLLINFLKVSIILIIFYPY